jgi:signal transduction histidine kinase
LRLWSVLAEGQNRVLDAVLAAQPLPVAAPRADLESALDALIGNVFAHTPAGVALAVIARSGAGGPELVVEDSGPGFHDLGLVGRGRSGAGSTGLGLDIAGRVATSTGGERLVGRSATGGARITLRFGAGSPPHRPSARGTGHTPTQGR